MKDERLEMRQPCESHGPTVSALVDGELESPDVLAVVDHLVECPDCRAFYHRARRLGEMTASSSAAPRESPPEELWRRIASASGLEDTSASPSGSGEAGLARRASAAPATFVRRWAPRLAALVVLGLGLWLVQYLPRPQRADDGSQIVVTLEENRGSMTEERFKRLAAEVLRADRHYHRKMLQVMRVAAAAATPSEGTVDRAEDRPLVIEGGGGRISLGEDDHLYDREGFVWRGQQL